MGNDRSLPARLWIAALKDADVNGSVLQGLDKYISEITDKKEAPTDVSRFYEGDNITITLRGVMIRECEDPKYRRDGLQVEYHPQSGGKTNDLFIVSNYQFGTDPKVEKIHFMQNSTPLGYVSDFLNRRILSVRDFKDLNECLTLNIRIYDIDKTDTKFVDMANELADNVIAAVPVLYQYSIPLKVATEGMDSIFKLVDDLDPHDKIIEERIDLEAANAGTKHPLLQQGYYVIFRNEVCSEKARSLKLVGNQLKVMTPGGDEFVDCSYAVIEVQKEFRVSPQEEIDEKVAKLASELSGNGQSGKAAIEFLRDTMKSYNNFKKLERATELNKKTDRTSSEENQLKDLLADPDIKKYLS
jgi:hypothetical protein